MPSAQAAHPAPSRRALVAVAAMLYYQGFTMAINGVAAPWIAQSFHLTDSGIAALYAWIALSSFGALCLSRLADRAGRRRVLMGCMSATPLCALGAALARDLRLFAIFEIGLYACIGATISGSVVMLAEELPVHGRARGQGLGGLATNLGGGLCVILMPLLDARGWSWRWLLGISAAWILAVPLLRKLLPESTRWETAKREGKTRASRIYDVFSPPYRPRSVPMLASFFLTTIASTAFGSWTYFHSVTVAGLSPSATSALIVAGGAVGLLGFPLGAWAAERFGRVPTVVCFGLLVAIGTVAFYWGPPREFFAPAVWLGSSYAWSSTAANAATVGANAAATELFPTALRGTMIGWFAVAGAAGALVSQSTIASLAEIAGGLSTVVGYLSMLLIPSVLIFGTWIEETRGAELHT